MGMVKKRSGRFLFWAPRVLAILFILFLAVFSFDVFEGGFSLLALGGFFIHSLPSIVMAVALFFLWNRDKAAGVVFLIFWFLFIIFFSGLRGIFFGEGGVESAALIVSAPILVVGILFLVNWYKNKR